MSQLAKQKKLTIGLLWHSVSSDNLGVGALTESQISVCEAAAQSVNCHVEYIIFGTQGGRSYLPENVEAKIGGRVSIKQILLGKSQFIVDVKKCDLVLDIGEGDSFADIYGVKRLLFLMISKMAVLKQNKPLILSPQTIGPFEQWWTKRWAVSVMRKCKKVFARDGLSFSYLQQLGLANIDKTIDVAFKLPYVKTANQQSSQIRIGINVSGLLFSGGYTKDNQFGLTVDYPALIKSLIEDWISHADYEVWLIPHVIPDEFPIEDDRKAISALQAAFPSVKVAPEFYSPVEAKSFIASMDFMTGARMHACIAAFSSQVPVVPLAYSRKFNGLFSTLDYPYIADGKTMTNQEAFDTIKHGFDQRLKLKEAVINGNKIAEQLLSQYQSYIADCMKKYN